MYGWKCWNFQTLKKFAQEEKIRYKRTYRTDRLMFTLRLVDFSDLRREEGIFGESTKGDLSIDILELPRLIPFLASVRHRTHSRILRETYFYKNKRPALHCMNPSSNSYCRSNVNGCAVTFWEARKVRWESGIVLWKHRGEHFLQGIAIKS